MKLSFNPTLFLTLGFFFQGSSMSNAQDECSTTWNCEMTSTPPVLDADFTEWENVEAYTTTMLQTTGPLYEAGDATYKCLYDADRIYLAMEIPGYYRFNSTDNHFCASIGTMMKIGAKATYVNMGGCPDAATGCDDGVPDTCDEYRVDIGAHWELSGTNQSTYYGPETDAEVQEARQAGEPLGNDLIANNDDEYSVSPYCRFDDDDANAGNEWGGAWAHTNSVEGELGNYHFEMSRTLKTPSTLTDAQLSPGDTIQFGIAFWDPYEIEETGWTDAGHYVTGCAAHWIDLELVAEGGGGDDTDTEGETGEGSSGVGFGMSSLLAVVVSASFVMFL